jgi:MYXO-CTERM domain-containing protein
VTAILELRTTGDAHRADLFDPRRLQPVVRIAGAPQPPPTILRSAPGVWFYSFTPPPGLGGSSVTFGATFDGQPIVISKTIPIAVDIWRAEYPSSVKGGCAIGSSSSGASGRRGVFSLGMLGAMLAFARRRRRPRAPARVPAFP